MFTEGRSDDYIPLAVVGKFPIYATELLVGIHVFTMVVFALWAGISGLPMGSTTLDFYTAYSPAFIVEKLQVWRLVSYSIQNYPSLGFALGMLMLWWFGREVEKFYGRRNFLISYAVLILAPALIGLLFHFPLQGPSEAHFAIFIMFAATYPGVLLLFNIQAKWMAWVYIGIFTLIHLANRNLSGLALLWLMAFLGYGLTRYLGRSEWLPEGLQGMLPSFGKPAFTVVRDEPPAERTDDPVSSIDPILEKIARSGLSSLSAKEHAALKAASGELQKKGGR
ncbi:MAG: rhomboid family intramembrane serine protease [Chthoniobacterales bacterium]